MERIARATAERAMPRWPEPAVLGRGDATAAGPAGLAPAGDGGPPGGRLRVLHLVAPAAVGGAETVLRLLASGFRRRGHDARVLAVAEPDQDLAPFTDAVEAAGVPLEVLRLPGRAYLREAVEVVRRCRRFRPHLLHSHGFRSDVVATAAGPLAGTPRVSTVHGWIGGDRKVRLYEGLQRLALRSFGRVVAVSRPLAERMVEAGVPEGKVRVVPNAYETEVEPWSREAARRELSVPGDAFHVGWVGRLSREKGPGLLLEALAGLDGEVPWRASLLGSGPLRDRLEARARELGVEGRVRLHGRVPAASRLFPAFDVFVLSSRTEGTPMVLLEAMDAGVPVVATRVGGVPDVAGSGTALLVPPADPRALGEAMRRVHDDPEGARERAREAGRRLESEFGVEGWLDRYDSVYREALTTPVPRRGEPIPT